MTILWCDGPASTDFLAFDDHMITVGLDTTEMTIREQSQMARYLDVFFERLRARRSLVALAALVEDVARSPAQGERLEKAGP